jgi:methionyl-tRNA formyltransferase
MARSLRIVYLGSPPFAVPTLEALHASDHQVVGVITAPDRKAGRGQRIAQTAVKKFAAENGLNLLQPKNLKAPEFQEKLRGLKADLQVVVAFRMLPEAVWNMPPMGTVNLHASLLPKYRGAAPIHWAIANGERETGLTTFRLRHEIDTGDLIFQERVAIGENETMGELMARMKNVGAALMLKTVNAIASGEAEFKAQDLSGDYPKAPKLDRETAKVEWTKPTEIVHNLIRGMHPFPGAWTELPNGQVWKIHNARKPDAETVATLPEDVEPGHLLTTNTQIFDALFLSKFHA